MLRSTITSLRGGLPLGNCSRERGHRRDHGATSSPNVDSASESRALVCPLALLRTAQRGKAPRTRRRDVPPRLGPLRPAHRARLVQYPRARPRQRRQDGALFAPLTARQPSPQTFLEQVKTTFNDAPGVSPEKIVPTIGQNSAY